MAEVTALRSNALPYAVYGVPFGIVFPYYDADGDLVSAATTPDSEISKNGDTFADCTNEATEIATTSGMWYLLLTGTELTCDVAAIISKSATAGMKTTPIVLYPRKLVTLASGTAAGGDTGYITLANGTVTYDDQFNGCLCVAVIDSVTEARILQDCTASNQQCTVTPAWNTAPDNNDTYIIYLPEGRQVPTSNVIRVTGTAQTARDIGASVLLSTGTGTGQLDFTSGVVKANLAQILGTALTETSGLIAAAFKKFFNVATPTGTVNSLADAVPGAAGGGFIAGTNAATTVTTALTTTFTGNLTGSVASVATNGITATSLAADAINAASIKAAAITNAKFAAGAIDAAAIADAAIDNATFAADVGSTALATNVIAKAAEKAVGVGGLSLTAIPWNANWDAEVESEANDALVVNNLDHLIKVAKDTDWATTVTKESVIDLMTSKSSAQTFDRATDTLEAIRDAVTVVSAGVAATIQATANTETTGTLVGGTYAVTYLSNATYYILAPVTPAVGGYGLNAFLTFGAASGQYINSVTIRGYFAAGPGRFCHIGAYNYLTSSIDILSDTTSRMNNASANATYAYSLLSAHQKSDGEVKIYFLSPSVTTGDRLNIDQCLVNVNTAGASASDIAAAVKQTMITLYYPEGVWIDTTVGGGVAGTTLGVNGLRTNPCSTYADAIIIAAALNLRQLRLKTGSSIELTQSHAQWQIYGGTVALAGQVITSAHFDNCVLSGTSSGTGMDFFDCHFTGTATVGGGDYYRCGFGVVTFTMIASSLYNFVNCFDDDPDTATSPIFVFAANAVVGARNWRGAFQVNGMASTNKLTIDGAGRLVIGSTSEHGAITIRGFFSPVTGGDGLHSEAEFVAHGGSITQTSRFDTTNVSDAALMRDWTAVTGTVPDRSTLNALRFLRNKRSIAAGTLTVTKEDDTTAAWTAAVTTSAAAEPVTAIDPAGP
jgi:hypothetical protein